MEVKKVNNSIIKLISISSESISSTEPFLCDKSISLIGTLKEEYFSFLALANGLYAFESALHVFPATQNDEIDSLDVNLWNSDDLWRVDYGSLAENIFFFAEDIFGCQFCVKDNRIHSFDPETADTEELCDSFEDWARLVLEDYDFLVGFPVAHDWQEQYGGIPYGKRLLPKVPFVGGGEFKIDNLYLLDAVKGMKARANFAKQISSLSDGEKIQIKIQ
jgi:hypothetical protein